MAAFQLAPSKSRSTQSDWLASATMGVGGSFGALKAILTTAAGADACKSVFRQVLPDSVEAKQYVADCGGVVAVAGNAYIYHDLHGQGWLAERMLEDGQHDKCVALAPACLLGDTCPNRFSVMTGSR
jgi:hypothetical protein